MSDANKIMGLVLKDKYVAYTYYVLLGATAAAVATTILFMGGIYIPGSMLIGVAALVGFVMALAGYFAFRDQFSALEQAHFLYMIVVVAAFYLIDFVLRGTMMPVYLIVCMAQGLMLFTGYNSWLHGRIITMANVKSEVQLALKRA